MPSYRVFVRTQRHDARLLQMVLQLHQGPAISTILGALIPLVVDPALCSAGTRITEIKELLLQ